MLRKRKQKKNLGIANTTRSRESEVYPVAQLDAENKVDQRRYQDVPAELDTNYRSFR